VARQALLGAFVIVFCIMGLVVGLVRLAPGRSAGDLLLATASAVLGLAVFALVLRIGRRSAAWTRWLLVPILVSTLFVDRLSDRGQLMLFALGAGYVGAFLATVVVRIVRITR
jgi:hypothetical protein